MPNKLCLSEISTFHDQCDQIGIFLKGLGNIFSNKCSSIIWQLFQKYDFLSKVYRDYFLVNIFKKIGRIFISSSGHTDHASNEWVMHHGKESKSFLKWRTCDERSWQTPAQWSSDRNSVTSLGDFWKLFQSRFFKK